MSLARTMVTLTTVVVLLLTAVAALLVHPDPRSYTTPGGGGSTSDVITYAEALVSLALTGGAIAAGWYLALGPIRRQRFG